MANIGLYERVKIAYRQFRDFGCTLENEHAASSKQVSCGIIKRGISFGKMVCELNGKFENRWLNFSYYFQTEFNTQIQK